MDGADVCGIHMSELMYVVYICQKRPPFTRDQKGSMESWAQSFWRQLEFIL